MSCCEYTCFPCDVLPLFLAVDILVFLAMFTTIITIASSTATVAASILPCCDSTTVLTITIVFLLIIIAMITITFTIASTINISVTIAVTITMIIAISITITFTLVLLHG